MNRPQPRYNPGDRIGGRYHVHKALMGGMGEVYLCLDEEEMNPYVLKTFQPRFFDSNALRAAFEEEVKTWIALEKHTNIVRCHFMEVVDNTPFMFLEWVAGNPSKGTSLREWLRHGPLDMKTALEVAIRILRGLRHAAAKSPGIVHRDLKPDNILMLEDGTPKITDFGLAKSAGAAKGITPDGETGSGSFGGNMRVGEIVGTPPYLPLEARPAFEQKLAWLQQIVGEDGASASSEQQAAEEAMRQVLGQQGMSSDQIEQLIAAIKQVLGEG